MVGQGCFGIVRVGKVVGKYYLVIVYFLMFNSGVFIVVGIGLNVVLEEEMLVSGIWQYIFRLIGVQFCFVFGIIGDFEVYIYI